jgi:raffinose/stachyose/melibiose transport system substrate-binding protein
MKIRRSMRHALAAAAALAVAAGALAGCSSSSGGDAKSLTMLTYDDAAPAQLMRDQLATFQKETGIKVTLTTLPGSGAAVYPGKLRTELTGGKGPDVWRIWGGSIGGPFAENGFAADLAKYYDKYDWNKAISSSYVDGMKWNGKVYGLPLYSAYMMLWYSKDAWQKAGITAPPTSYDQLTADNEKLVAAGQVPMGLGGKYGWDVMRLFEYLLEKNAGPELHDKLLKGTASWDDPAVEKAFTELKEWSDKGWLPKGVLGIDPADSEPGFTQGKYGATISGSWVDSTYVAKASDPKAYGVAALPTDQSTQRHSGWVEGFMINAASSTEKQDNAAKLLDFLAKPDTQKALQNTQSTVVPPDAAQFPLSVQAAEIASKQPFYTIQDQALPADVANAYFSIQSEVIQGSVTPAEAAKQMQAAVSKGMKSSK